MLIKLAWRNIWRNRKRTLIILGSIIVGIIAIIFFEGLSLGMLKQMVNSQINIHTTHIQIHKNGFNDEKIVQNYIPDKNVVLNELSKIRGIKSFSPRIIAFGLMTSAENSSGVNIVGVDSEREKFITELSNYIIEGRYLSNNLNEVLVSQNLAKNLGVGLNDKIVLFASMIDGKVGTEMFRVVGLYQTPISSYDKMNIYIPIVSAQKLLGLNDNISEIAIIVKNFKDVPEIRNSLVDVLGLDYEVLSYRELIPGLVMQMEMTDSWMMIIYIIVGLAMIFGIINTILMSVFERVHEFGILKSIGMMDLKLFFMIVMESLLLGLVGAIIGSIIGGFLVHQLSISGLNFSVFSEGLSSWGISAIVYPELQFMSIIKSVFVIICVSILASIYPAIKAIKLQPIQAIKYV